MRKRIVKISPQESCYIEKLFFEYNASLDILKFLTSKEIVNKEHLQDYIKISENRFIELEIAKKTISDIYRPKDFQDFQYTFDFEKEEIIYSTIKLKEENIE